MLSLARQLSKAVLASPALRQSAELAGGTAISGVFLGLAMIIASRTLGPEKFGVLSVSIALTNILSRGIDLGLNQLMPRLMNLWLSDKKKVRSFLGQIIRWKLMLAFLTTMIGVLLIPVFTWVLQYPHVDMLIWSIVGSLFVGLYEYVVLVLSANHSFRLAGALGILHGLVKFSGFLIFLLLGLSTLNGFSAIYYTAPALAALTAAWFFRGTMWVFPRPASQQIRKKIFKYLGHGAIGVITFSLFLNLDLLFVQGSLNSLDTGLYAGATRLAVFIGYISTSVMSVLNNRVSRYRDKKTLTSYLKKSVFFVLISVLGFLLFLPIAKPLLVYTIGPQYLSGLLPLIILILNAFLTLAITPYVSFFYSVDHPRYFSIGGVLQVAALVIGNIFFLPVYGVIAAAWIKVVATLIFSVYTVAYVSYALKSTPVNSLHQGRDLVH